MFGVILAVLAVIVIAVGFGMMVGRAGKARGWFPKS